MNDEPRYSEAMERIEEILRTIEDEEVDIDALGGLVEEAAQLIQLCRRKIAKTEMRVRKVIEDLDQEEGKEA